MSMQENTYEKLKTDHSEAWQQIWTMGYSN